MTIVDFIAIITLVFL